MPRKNAELITQCAWCKRLLIDGTWEPYDVHIPVASHGICIPCQEKMIEEWTKGKKKKGNPMVSKRDPLIGAFIVAIRPATAEEKHSMMWHRDFMVIELNTGVAIFASSDEEMNDAGVLNYTHGGNTYSIFKKR